MTNLGRH